ncbi:MAG: transposase [Candidatus Peregrinibacteria bacterium]
MSQRHPIQNDRMMLVTTNTYNREPIFFDPSFAREAVERLYRIQELHPFLLFGFVIMPDHCHFLVKIPSPYTISKLMNDFKTGLTFDLGIRAFWQRRFHIRLLCDPYHALRYIHRNPVKAGMVETPEDYPWSSASGRWDVSPIDAS